MRLLYTLLLIVIICISSQAQRDDLPLELKPFYHGVASGDPLSDKVIIWTRVTPDSFIPGDSIQVKWRMATDTGLQSIVSYGETYTSDLRDFTVKVDVQGLQANTCYYYDFFAEGKYSVRGRTKTAPSGQTDSVRFAVVSCSNYEHGYFNAYRILRNRNDIDVILHLGDYIYEYETGGYSAGISGRENDPAHEIIALDDYRTRYSHYRLDDDLRDLHQQHPFITVWDDHESANDSYKDGAENHTDGTEGNWSTRKSNAKQAYFEWLPVRENTQEPNRLYRQFKYGNLINLLMLDTRLEGRSEQVGATSSAVNDPNRSILGTDQYDWMKNELINSSAKWNILGQQVMMAPLEIAGLPVNGDQWDGYNYERNRLFNDILINGIDNLVVLTGDIHTSWANDLPLPNYDGSTGENSIGVEFVVTSVTSPGFPFNVGTSVIQAANDHMQWIDLTEHGYLILDVNQQRVQGEWYFVNDITQAGTGESLGNAFYVNDGTGHLQNAVQTSQRIGMPCNFAPEDPLPAILSVQDKSRKDLVLLGLYPNPAQDQILLQLNALERSITTVRILSIDGSLMKHMDIDFKNGLNYLEVDISDLSTGTYLMSFETEKGVQTHRFVKN